MTVIYTEDPSTATAEITVSGRITRDDYDVVIDRMQDFIDAQGTIRLIEIIESFEGFDPSVIWPGIKFDMKNIRHISHVAIVSDVGWIGPISKAAGALLSCKLRTFDRDGLDEARAWIMSAKEAA